MSTKAAADTPPIPGIELYHREARALPVEAVPDLREILSLYLDQVRQLQEEHPFIDLDLVERIGVACSALLDLYGDLEEPARAAVVGAIRYFVIEEDAEGDLDSIVGFDDDARVVNWVINRFGLPVQPVGLED